MIDDSWSLSIYPCLEPSLPASYAISKVGMFRMGAKRGRKPGSPKTGGRVAGTPNRHTRELKELAMQFVPRAIEELGAMATATESGPTKLGAIREIFALAVGKAP